MLHDSPQPPSWGVPIALGAALSFVAGIVPVVQSGLDDPGGSLAMCCCGSVTFLPLGFVPSFVALRRDRGLTAGQGFAVSFIAVGLAQVVLAVILTLAADPETHAAFESAVRSSLDESMADLPADRRPGAEEVDLMVERLMAVVPYLPAIVALITSLLAGLTGLATVAALGRGRRQAGAGGPAES